MHETILIDDTPMKSICNANGNAIFLESWSHAKRRDDVLMGELLPWLRRLHEHCPRDELLEYVEDNRIGLQPLNHDNPYVKDVVKGMKESAKVMGAGYALCTGKIICRRNWKK